MKPALQITVLSATVIGGVLAALALFVGNPFAEGPAYRLRPDDAATVALGEAVYARHCAGCHGAQLQGQPDWQRRDAGGRLPAPPHDATGHTWHHPDEVLFRLTKFGVARSAGLQSYPTAMPIYEGVLSDAEIVAVLSWIKSQWPGPIRARHDSLNQAAAR